MPYFTGKIIDYASIEPDHQMFQQTTLKLVGVAFGCAVFTGVRGGLFTVGMARLNLRIRTNLFDSLLRQDIGFFDTTKTGEITSRSLAMHSDPFCTAIPSFLLCVLLDKSWVPSQMLTSRAFKLCRSSSANNRLPCLYMHKAIFLILHI